MADIALRRGIPVNAEAVIALRDRAQGMTSWRRSSIWALADGEIRGFRQVAAQEMTAAIDDP
jgi:hypothetical protein